MIAMARLFSVVIVMAALGVVAGYAAGVLTDPGSVTPSGGRSSVDFTATPSPPQAKKTPRPNRAKALDPTELEYWSRTFTVAGSLAGTITAEVPSDWKPTRPADDEARFTDPTRERYIRIKAGYPADPPPPDSMRNRAKAIQNDQPAANDLIILSRTTRKMTNVSGRTLTVATLAYTFIPELDRRYVLTRWIALGKSGKSAVEISVTGFPQDKKALEAVLDRATKTVKRG